ncbi:MAG: cyclase family protein [Chloroflexi bacterium]|nr:cyclase family protein [Chloroflexota bacterium]
MQEIPAKIYDITMTLESDMLIWPGNAPVSIEPVKRIAEGSSSNVSLLHVGTHSGTHVDAPYHFVEGAPGIDSIPLEVLAGPARLVQLPEVERIDRTLLEKLDLSGVSRLLLGTRNSALLRQPEHTPDYVSLSESGARYLVEMGIKLVGIDYLSIEEYKKEGYPTHRTLLESGVVIVEGLNLSGVPSGDYELLCLPLKLKGADGAPARAFLRELNKKGE